MRTIKFRAWDKRNKLMIHNIFSVSEVGTPDLLYPLVPPDLIWMQFTGLHDKNGKEIWEGDIVLDCGYRGNVIYSAPYFMLDSMPYGGPAYGIELRMSGGRCEVLGNIYENPELLKGEVKP